MRIVITGGAGFIGSNLAEVLSKDNANEVIVLDDLSTGKLVNTKEMAIKFVNGSITDLELLQTIFKDVDYVLHQAAIPSVPRSVNEPIASNNENIDGTLNVLVAARDRNVKKVVYASSSSVYGDTPKLPKREDMTPTPLSPYAVTKLTGEHYCNVFNEVYGLKTVALRYFNVYGPKQDPHSDYAAVIPKFVSRVLRDEPPMIYGDGQQTRDFTFVKDVVTANIRAMKSDATGVFNIASGNRITIQELAELVMKLMAKDLGVILEEPRKGDVLHSLADVSKAKAGFGYEPGYRLETGLEETVKWFS